ncbi:WD40 repeat-like protein [Piromyces finnis]|uniref:Peroxin-7 n=1 Tax=Piromyces finnis TaxID=1754191 RepID=A0A1Y1VN69_9FUNG|nr:WD40 repeat-like protein [Piromyces finnis]|eukprot:ORX60867.1 WD40 repeat-like protein [Piromyces finnis]
MAAPIPMLTFHTAGYNGYSVEFSSFFEGKLACAAASNYGIVGNGRLFVLNIHPQGLAVERIYDTQDGLFDCAWSEINENQLVTSSGDGSIKLWDLTLADYPIRNWAEHTREVFCVHWNLVKKDTFITGSWDQTIKIWNPEIPHSLQTYKEHNHCIYNTTWSPYDGDIFASCSGDHTVKIWDAKIPRSAQTIRAHNAEILALDWNKYRENVIITGSVDHLIKIWDLRFPDHEVQCLRGHDYAVRNIKCSPHSGDILASTSYDMTMRLWNTCLGPQSQVFVDDHHTEFVLGVDFNLYVEGQIATCAWDEQICVSMPQQIRHF